MQFLRMAGRSGMPFGGWAHRATALVTAMLVGGSVLAALATSPAAAATPGPQPGVTPSAARAGSTIYVAYTGSDQHVYLRNVTQPTQRAVGLGGRLVGGPGLASAPPGLLGAGTLLAVFGRGTDNALWWRHQTATGWTGWQSLGGVLTSNPGAMTGMSLQFGLLTVFVRGTDGRTWYRTWVSGWNPWIALGGPRLLAGAGPGSASTGYLALTGTDRHVWLFGRTGMENGFTGFVGLTTANPGNAAAQPGYIAVFARGTDNALWYRLGPLPASSPYGPWHSLGGRLTSGVTATTVPGGKTYVFVLGTDNQIWMRAGTWPNLGPWTRL